MKPIIIYESKIARYFDIDGLVLYPFVLINESEDNAMPSTIKHELTHVRQVERDGFCQFYSKYFGHMFRHLLKGDVEGAFTEHEYEKEAYGIEMVALNEDDIIMSNWKGSKTDKEQYKRKNNDKKNDKKEKQRK
jgi:hypothetical protein